MGFCEFALRRVGYTILHGASFGNLTNYSIAWLEDLDSELYGSADVPMTRYAGPVQNRHRSCLLFLFIRSTVSALVQVQDLKESVNLTLNQTTANGGRCSKFTTFPASALTTRDQVLVCQDQGPCTKTECASKCRDTVCRAFRWTVKDPNTQKGVCWLQIDKGHIGSVTVPYHSTNTYTLPTGQTGPLNGNDVRVNAPSDWSLLSCDETQAVDILPASPWLPLGLASVSDVPPASWTVRDWLNNHRSQNCRHCQQ